MRNTRKLFATMLSVFMSVNLMHPQNVLATSEDGQPVGTLHSENQVTGESVLTKINYVKGSMNFNDGWLFKLGNLSGAVEGNTYDDSSFASVTLPHDFSIDQTYSSSLEAESAYLPGGTGWYRKQFTVSNDLQGKEVYLSFDGSYMDTTVYLNGTKLVENHYGYNPFMVKITDAIDFEHENVLAVKVVNDVPTSRWYSGSGLSRDVNLIVKGKTHFMKNGIFVYDEDLKTNYANNQAILHMDATVNNTSDTNNQVKLKYTLKDEDRVVSSFETDEFEVSSNASKKQQSTMTVNERVKLWSPKTPKLYKMEVDLIMNGEVVDHEAFDYGFKYMEFNSGTGFKLNGEPTKLQGVCLHHDQGSLGAVQEYDALARQIDIMKDMGVNTIRTSHNTPSKAFVELCSKKGILVNYEIFDGWRLPKNWNRNDFARFFNASIGNTPLLVGSTPTMTWPEFVIRQSVERDRNEASIMMYSMGNEITEGTRGDNSDFPQIFTRLADWTESVDNTKPLTIGDNKRTGNTVYRDIQRLLSQRTIPGLNGYNYADGPTMDTLHNNNRNYLMYGSETASSVNSRGEYKFKGNANKRCSSYDTSKVPWGHFASDGLYTYMTRDFNMGEYVWTGFDYLGEPTPWNGDQAGPRTPWPSPKSSFFGIVETTGFEKDSYYLYRSIWNKESTTLHVLPAWNRESLNNHANQEVVVYTSAPRVKLFYENNEGQREEIFDRTFAQKQTTGGFEYQLYEGEGKSNVAHENLYLKKSVQFRPGKLVAEAYDAEGHKIDDTVGRSTVVTSGAPAKLVAKVNKDHLKANDHDLSYITIDVLDEHDNFVPYANNNVVVNVSENGRLRAMDNGEQADHTPFSANHRNAYNGKVLAIVQATKSAGEIRVDITSEGLEGTSVTLNVAEVASEKQVTGYEMAKTIMVKQNTVPTLPAKAKVFYSDGSHEEHNVTFDTSDLATKVAKDGSFSVNGTIQDVNIPCHVNVLVVSTALTALNQSSVCRQGETKQLEPYGYAIFSDGKKSKNTFPVTWNAYNTSTLHEGEQLVVTGTMRVFDQELPITNTVRCLEVNTTKGGNIARNTNSISQSIEASKQSDTLSAITDGNRTENLSNQGGGKNPNVWSNYAAAQDDQRQNSLNLEWATLNTVGSVDVYYYIDTWASQLPESVAFTYKNDKEPDYHPIQTTQTQEVINNQVTKVTYTFEQPVSLLNLELLFTNGTQVKKAKPTTAISEIEVNSVGFVYETYRDLNVSKMLIDGNEAEDLFVNVSSISTSSAKGTNVVLETTKNTAMTVYTMADMDYVYLVSEDGSIESKKELVFDRIDFDPTDATKDIDPKSIQARAGSEHDRTHNVDNVKDGNEDTIWHTNWNQAVPIDKFYVDLELDGNTTINGIRYLPRKGEKNGIYKGYKIEVSDDKVNFREVAKGEWDSTVTWKKATFDSVTPKVVRVRATSTFGSQTNKWASAAEIRVRKASKQEVDSRVVEYDGSSNKDQVALAFDRKLDTMYESVEGSEAQFIEARYKDGIKARGLEVIFDRKNVTAYKMLVKKTKDGAYEEVLNVTDNHSLTGVCGFDAETTIYGVKVEVSAYGDTGVNAALEESTKQAVGIKEVVFLKEAVTFTEASDGTNIAQGKQVSLVQGQSENGNGIANINDGSKRTRWASEHTIKHNEVLIDLGSIYDVRTMKVLFDKRAKSQGPNVKNFDIYISNDGSYFTLEQTRARALGHETPSDEDAVSFEHTQKARYVKFVTKDSDVQDKSWINVSVIELELYPNVVEVSFRDFDSLQTLQLNTAKDAVIIPTGDGATIQITGSSADQVISTDNHVYEPLQDIDVKLYLELVSDSGERLKEKEVVVHVPGKYGTSNGVGTKPEVIPVLQQFVGKEGTTQITNETGIVCDPAFTSTKDQYINDLRSRGVELVDGEASKKISIVKVDNKGYGEEGYYININDGNITIEAQTNTGAFYATQTLLQIGQDNLQNGEILDWPNYPVRGYMIDTGRKFIDAKTINEIIRNMGYYKMNDLQLHLNDNLIFLESYGANPYGGAYGSETDIKWLRELASTVESGFRIETEFENTVDGEVRKLTSKDHYSSEEFKNFVRTGKQMGVRVVPEIDSPAHAMAITRVWPELMYTGRPSAEYAVNHKDNRRAEELDLAKPETKAKMQEIIGSLIDGPFAECDVIHIGTDEFMGDNRVYRTYANDMLKFIEDKGKTPRFWGSLTKKPGNPKVDGKNTYQMGLWSLAWDNPQHALDNNFMILNMLDNPNYTVPTGTGDRNNIYTRDYLNLTNSYNFEPNVFAQTTVAASNPRIIGGAFACWNDYNIDKKDVGLTSIDEFKFFFDGLPVMAQKTWSNRNLPATVNDLVTIANQKGLAPRSNPYDTLEAGRAVVIDFTKLDGATSVSVDNQELVFSKDSKIETGINGVGPNGSLQLSLAIDAIGEEQTLLRNSDNHRIYITSDGHLAYDYDTRTYVYDYVFEPNNKTSLLFVNTWQHLDVYVNDELVEPIRDPKHPERQFQTFVIPLKEIGGFSGKLANLNSSSGTYVDPNQTSSDEITNIQTNSEEPNQGLPKEGPKHFAYDGDVNTYWHSKWDGTPRDELKWISNDFTTPINLKAVNLRPRLSAGGTGGASNGVVTKANIYVKQNGTWNKVKSEITFANDPSLKRVVFDQVLENVEGFKLEVVEGVGNYASMAEITFKKGELEAVDKTHLLHAIQDANDAKETFAYKNASAAIKETFDQALAAAIRVSEEERPTFNAMNSAKETLDNARNALDGIDTTPLQQAIDTATTLLEDVKYQNASDAIKLAFDTALNTAKESIKKQGLKEEEMNAAITALTQASENLDGKAVDKQPLIELIESANTTKTTVLYLNSDEGLKTAFDVALETAINVKDNPAATATMVQDALEALGQASNNLNGKEAAVPSVDLEPLRTLHASAVAIKETPRYTNSEESLRNAFDQALANANTVLTSEAPNAETVQQATTTLQNALDTLNGVAETVDKTELIQLIEQAKQELTKATYLNATQEKKDAFDQALTNANTIKEKADASNDDVTSAIETLTNAKNALDGQEVVPVDKSQLLTAITNAIQAKTSDAYLYASDASKQAFEQALQHANDVNANTSANEEDVTNAITSLTEKQGQLDGKKPVDKSALQASIQAATDAMTTPAYIYASTEKKTAFDQALATANTINKKADASEADVTAALNALKTAKEQLDGKVPVVDKTALKAAIKDAEKAKETVAYKKATAEKKNAFDTALAKAKTLEDKADASEADVTAAVNALNTAKEQLDGKDVDLTSLKAAIKDAEKAKKTVAYKKATDEKKNAFDQALANAKTVKGNADASEADVNAAVNALNTAKDQLDGKEPVAVKTVAVKESGMKQEVADAYVANVAEKVKDNKPLNEVETFVAKVLKKSSNAEIKFRLVKEKKKVVELNEEEKKIVESIRNSSEHGTSQKAMDEHVFDVRVVVEHESESQEVHELAKPQTVVLELPEKLRGYDTYEVHHLATVDGKLKDEVVANVKYDPKAHTVTFEQLTFSKFVVVGMNNESKKVEPSKPVKPAQKPTAKASSTTVPSTNVAQANEVTVPRTDDQSHLGIWSIVFVSMIASIFGACKHLKKC